MIALTPLAAAEIAKAQAEKGIAGFGLKLQIVGGGCEGYLYDLLFVEGPEPEDREFQSQGIRLYVDERALPALDGTTIDHANTRLGPGLVFINPRARSRCACGASFRL
jgi:iron-sulfur cluster assembly accessory protein